MYKFVDVKFPTRLITTLLEIMQRVNSDIVVIDGTAYAPHEIQVMTFSGDIDGNSFEGEIGFEKRVQAHMREGLWVYECVPMYDKLKALLGGEGIDAPLTEA